MTSYISCNDPEAFFRIIEKQARHYPVEATRITGKEENLCGLFLFRKGLSRPERQKALGRVLKMAAAEPGRAPEEGDDPICHVPKTLGEDSCQVTTEERAQLFSFLKRESN